MSSEGLLGMLLSRNVGSGWEQEELCTLCLCWSKPQQKNWRRSICDRCPAAQRGGLGGNILCTGWWMVDWWPGERRAAQDTRNVWPKGKETAGREGRGMCWGLPRGAVGLALEGGLQGKGKWVTIEGLWPSFSIRCCCGVYDGMKTFKQHFLPCLVNFQEFGVVFFPGSHITFAPPSSCARTAV